MRRWTTPLALLVALMMLTGCAAREGGEGTSASASAREDEAPRTTVTVAVSRSIPFAPEARVREPVREQCELQTKTPSFIREFGPDYGVEVRLVEDLDRTDVDRRLHLEITGIHAPAGGGFAGGMWMQVEGRLTRGGRTVATVASRRITSGGYFAQFKGTCDIVGRCSRAIGRDLARWLADPRDGARLGNL